MNRSRRQSGDILLGEPREYTSSYFFATPTDSRNASDRFVRKNRHDTHRSPAWINSIDFPVSARIRPHYNAGPHPTYLETTPRDLLPTRWRGGHVFGHLGPHAAHAYCHSRERTRVGPVRSLPRDRLFPGDIQYPRKRERPFETTKLRLPEEDLIVRLTTCTLWVVWV